MPSYSEDLTSIGRQISERVTDACQRLPKEIAALDTLALSHGSVNLCIKAVD
jgi:hypothetical protein